MKLRGNVLERCRPVEINATTLKETKFLLCAIFFFVILQFVVRGFQFRDIAENLKKIIKNQRRIMNKILVCNYSLQIKVL